MDLDTIKVPKFSTVVKSEPYITAAGIYPSQDCMYRMNNHVLCAVSTIIVQINQVATMLTSNHF